MNTYRSIFKKRRRSGTLGPNNTWPGHNERSALRSRRGLSTCCVFLLLLSSLLLPLAGSPLHAAAPVSTLPLILAIEPDHAYNDQDTPIAIRGAGFAEGALVTLEGCYPNRHILADVTIINSTLLTGTIPAGLPAGTFVLYAINPDGQKSEPFYGLTLQRRGDASLDTWELTSPMTSPRWRFAAVTVNGSLYAIGGNGRDSSAILSSIERAVINPDGSLGAWHIVGTLSSPRASLAAVAVGDAIYVLGGELAMLGPYSAGVERAAVNSDGSLGPWQVLSPMMTLRMGHAAVVLGGYLYALGGFPGNGGPLSSVERAAINPDGTLGPWQPAASMTMPRSRAVTMGSYIYAVGGDNSVERSEVLPDGRLAPWQIVSAMIEDRAETDLVVVGGYLYVLGGSASCGYSNSVERAALYGDGTIGSWEQTASMWASRSGFAAEAVGQRLYGLGGMSGWNGSTRSVEYALASTRLKQTCFLPMVAR